MGCTGYFPVISNLLSDLFDKLRHVYTFLLFLAGIARGHGLFLVLFHIYYYFWISKNCQNPIFKIVIFVLLLGSQNSYLIDPRSSYSKVTSQSVRYSMHPFQKWKIFQLSQCFCSSITLCLFMFFRYQIFP